MSELFDEVDEEVRREQLKKLWDKYSIVFIALMVLVVAAVGGWRGYQYLEGKKAAEAGAAFEKAAELSDQDKHAEAEAAFAELAAKAPSGYRILARLRAAAEAGARDPKAAAKMYDDIAADRGVGGEWQDLARIRAAGLLVDSASYADMQQRLEASAAPKSTFRHTAREMLALSAWRNNDTTAARKWLDAIADDGETPPGLRSRAEALQALLPPVAKS
ncbi:tetratricopeptide repeat protein [Bradyrhizobium diazoefficiens]|nr:tetratricopeptide repeat protein [Bradyrhizobium diazoefficiens]UCF54424.1 MAG: tetratricopeptide repeat protein [Bradyrhizobium sp.]MBR0962837.1 tetratricopeptide repeat protein [Bradyrhizobium diazoefficiens]MBR0976997.1 tetratricopeptide repeat protein [Bradyrhizobium diazoefficiens]MBR1005642.1 tetratricopeptide repeat protein [Bradyrhizobium diazoefficiens]MBR1012115.1 tetratricopeptide repeat protein [Bradyrhizobium diazoefficiens]